MGDYLATTDEAAAKKGELKVKTLMFLSPAEVEALAKELAAIVKKDPKAKDLEKAVAKACKSAALKDAADIAIFGRMVASDHSLTLEGQGCSAMRSPRIVRTTILISFRPWMTCRRGGSRRWYDRHPGVHFRYLLPLCGAKPRSARRCGSPRRAHGEERKEVVETFLHGAVLAVPGARKTR